MVQYIEPNKNSDLVATGASSPNAGVLFWLKSLSQGLLSGFTVSKGTSGFDINISNGELVIGSTTIKDDAIKNDSDIVTLIMGGGASANGAHVIVYGQYTYQDTYPPAPMTIAAVKDESAPPVPPAMLVDSVKLADIFIPALASDLSAAHVVNAQPLPARGQQVTDVLARRLATADRNLLVSGGGVMSYDQPGSQIVIGDDIIVYSQTVTEGQVFMSAPMTAGKILAGSVAGATDDCLVFVKMSRESAMPLAQLSAPPTLTPLVMDLGGGGFQPDMFTDEHGLVILAAVVGGVFVARPGLGTGIPAPDPDPDAFLRNIPGGPPIWSAITTDLVKSILSISSFSAGAPWVELGQVVDTPAFTAVTADDGGDGPATAALTNDANSEALDVSGSWVGSTGTFNSAVFGYQELVPGANRPVTFTLAANDGATPAVATTQITWMRNSYVGFDPNQPLVSAMDLLYFQSLDRAFFELRPGLGFTFSLAAPAADSYLYIAWPLWKGGITSIIDNATGFEVFSAFAEYTSAGDYASVATDNAAAVVEDYRVYKSNQLQTGAMNLTVS